MSTNKIFCFGDGYATGHIWPEWPQILQAVALEFEVCVIAGIGAGPEWLVTRLVQEIERIPNSTVIFQWPAANRFDKLVVDRVWKKIGSEDPIYHFNFQTHHDQTWWLSSASKNARVVEYHDIVQNEQHQQRLHNYKLLVDNTLKNLNCKVVFTSTNDQEKFSQQSRFKTVRQCQVQPSPIVHYYFLREIILPQLDYAFPEIEKFETPILQQNWVAYDADRQSIWEELCNTLATSDRSS